MLTRKQHELLSFIHQRLEETGISPSFEEMKEALNLKSKSGIHRLITALEERGFIRRLPHRARALEVLKVPDAAPAGAKQASNVIEPMVETEALIQSRPYITRLYTTLSAEEMTEDPVFNFNPDLPSVANIHVATRIIECNPKCQRGYVPSLTYRVSTVSYMVLRDSESWMRRDSLRYRPA